MNDSGSGDAVDTALNKIMQNIFFIFISNAIMSPFMVFCDPSLITKRKHQKVLLATPPEDIILTQ